jgi:hypothetical protein
MPKKTKILLHFKIKWFDIISVNFETLPNLVDCADYGHILTKSNYSEITELNYYKHVGLIFVLLFQNYLVYQIALTFIQDQDQIP